MVVPRQLVGLGGCSPASPNCPPSRVRKQHSFGFSASLSLRVFAMRSPLRAESLSSIGTTALTTPSWCLVGAFAMRSPLWVEFFSDLDQNEDSSASFLRFGAKPLRWGHPYRVLLRMYEHSIGTKASSIHLSFVASRWGHPMGRVWFSSHSIETKSSLDSWSVFLQDGVTVSGQILAI